METAAAGGSVEGRTRRASLVARDVALQEPARFVARQVTAAGSPAWLYRFGYVADAMQDRDDRVKAGSDLPFVFDQLDAIAHAAGSERDRAVAAAMHEYFVRFVRAGDPNAPGLSFWPMVAASQTDLMLINAAGQARFQRDPTYERLELVAQHAGSAAPRD